MKDLVSNRMMGGVALVVAMAAVWSIFVSDGLAWPSLVSVGVIAGLAVAAAYWRGTQAQRSITQVLDVVEAEPRLAVAVSSAVTSSRGVARP